MRTGRLAVQPAPDYALAHATSQLCTANAMSNIQKQLRPQTGNAAVHSLTIDDSIQADAMINVATADYLQ